MVRLLFDEEAFEFNGRIWTKASEPTNWRGAFDFCDSRGVRLNTLDEAVECRFRGSDNLDDCYHTSTFVCLVNDGKEVRGYVVEYPSAQSVGIKDRSFIARDLELRVDSEYVINDVVRKLMPSSAQKNADVIKNRGYKTGLIVFDRPPVGEAKVVPVLLGGSVYSSVNRIYVCDMWEGVAARGRGSKVISPQSQ